MYAGISDILNDFFGTHFTSSFPPTFGTLVAISFLLASWTLVLEFRRKEKAGILHPISRKIMIGEKATSSELIWNSIFGFLIGFKIVYAFVNSDEFFSNPQKAILSLNGNLAGGLVIAALFYWMKYREKEKQRLKEPRLTEILVYPHQIVSELTMASAFGGLLGAKIFHIFEYWGDFVADPMGMFFSGSGLTMYGGLIVGGISILWYGYKNGIHPLQLADSVCPGVMLAYGTGRLGCQLSGDGDWGIINHAPKPEFLSMLPDWFWSYRYPNNVVNEGIPIENCVGNFCNQLADPVYPTPLYESIACILLFLLLWKMRKQITVPGMLFSWYLIFNGIERFLIEGIRVNSKYHLAGIDFSQAQLISLLLIIGGLMGLLYLRKKTPTHA